MKGLSGVRLSCQWENYPLVPEVGISGWPTFMNNLPLESTCEPPHPSLLQPHTPSGPGSLVDSNSTQDISMNAPSNAPCWTNKP